MDTITYVKVNSHFICRVNAQYYICKGKWTLLYMDSKWTLYM